MANNIFFAVLGCAIGWFFAILGRPRCLHVWEDLEGPSSGGVTVFVRQCKKCSKFVQHKASVL